MQYLAVGTIGPPYAPRLCIIDENQNYWNEKGWTKNPKQASLYTDLHQAGEKVYELMLSQVPGKLTTYAAVFFIDVKDRNPVNLADLQDWLANNVHIRVNGLGTNDPMLVLRIDWSQVKEITNE